MPTEELRLRRWHLTTGNLQHLNESSRRAHRIRRSDMDKKIPMHVQRRSLTAELVALVERFEPDPGPEPGTTEHTEAEFDAMLETLLVEYKPEELWVFAYGSVLWNPEFEFLESRRATASGWHRSFCLKLTRWRGTRELPALMLALDRGGSCNGLAYRLPAQDHFKQLGLFMC